MENMPYGDRTGLIEAEAMKAKGLGYCAGHPTAGYINRIGGWGRHWWQWLIHRPGGYGWRHCFWATGLPRWLRWRGWQKVSPLFQKSPATEREVLEELKQQLQARIQAIEDRLQQLRQTKE